MIPTLKLVDRPLSLSDQVYKTLRDHLQSGLSVAGQPLQEVPLALKLGVSRTPVREALRRLASENRLVFDGRSFAVPDLGLSDIDDIYELRFLIEPAAIRQIAKFTADPTVRKPIENALTDAIAAHKANDTNGFREANVRFRAAWLALVPNCRLVKMVEQYADHMQHIRALTLGSPKIHSVVLKGLKSITTALRKGDATAAEAAMLNHLREARRSFIVALGLDAKDEKPITEQECP